jgi:hypothetical protein
MRRAAGGVQAAMLLALSSGVVAAQRATIPESMASGATARFTTMCGPSPTIDDVLARTALVVRGVAGVPRSYLSDDQMEVLTDVPIIGAVVLFDAATPAAGPSFPSREVLITWPGGQIIIDGQPFEDRLSGLQPLEPGTDVLLLLERSGGRLMPVLTYHGAFALDAAGVHPLVTSPRFVPSYRDAIAEDVIDDVLRRLRQPGAVTSSRHMPNQSGRGRVASHKTKSIADGTPP